MYTALKSKISTFFSLQPSAETVIKRYEKRIQFISDGCLPAKSLISQFNIDKNIHLEDIKFLEVKIVHCKDDKELINLKQKIILLNKQIKSLTFSINDLTAFVLSIDEIVFELKSKVSAYQTQHTIAVKKIAATSAFRNQSAGIRESFHYMDDHFLKMEARAKAELEVMQNSIIKKNPYAELDQE